GKKTRSSSIAAFPGGCLYRLLQCRQGVLQLRGGRPMARRLTLAAVLLFAALPLGALSFAKTAEAQVATVWVGTYPQVLAGGCVHYVAAWSDGTFTSTPRLCPPGVAPIRGNTRAAVVDSYGQESLNVPGCIEFVTRWADGAFTWVPYWCPYGLLYFKPGTVPVAVPV